MYTNEIDAILAKAAALADGFSQSALYRDYLAAKQAIEKDPALTARVKEYKKAQTAYEYKRLQADSADFQNFDEEKHVANLYTELTLNSHAAHFLACERTLLALYRQTFDMLCDACEMDC